VSVGVRFNRCGGEWLNYPRGTSSFYYTVNYGPLYRDRVYGRIDNTRPGCWELELDRPKRWWTFPTLARAKAKAREILEADPPPPPVIRGRPLW
jgi:hypothetical protein